MVAERIDPIQLVDHVCEDVDPDGPPALELLGGENDSDKSKLAEEV